MVDELTPEEREELEALRAEKKLQIDEHGDVAARDRESNSRDRSSQMFRDRSSQMANQPTPDDNSEEDELPDTHWLTLADGRTIESKGTMTHYEGIPVLYSTPIPIDPETLTPAHRF